MCPQVHSEFSIYFVNLLWIHYVLGWFTLKPIIVFANSLWINCIHYLLREFTRDPLIFRVLTLNLLFLSRIHSQSIIFFANPLWIHYLFANSLWIHYLLRQFATLSVSRFHYRPINVFANSFFIYYLFARSLWILYLFREFTFYFFTLYD